MEQLDALEKITTVLVNLTIIAASFVAVIKLKLYRLMERRVRTEFRATHSELSNGKILFEGDYVVHNTGERPIKLTRVDLGLYGVRNVQGQVEFDRENKIFRRIITEENKDLRDLLNIQSGERSTFTIRCELSQLEEMTFVDCRFEWPYKRKPAAYHSLYLKKRGATFSG